MRNRTGLNIGPSETPHFMPRTSEVTLSKAIQNSFGTSLFALLPFHSKEVSTLKYFTLIQPIKRVDKSKKIRRHISSLSIASEILS